MQRPPSVPPPSLGRVHPQPQPQSHVPGQAKAQAQVPEQEAHNPQTNTNNHAGLEANANLSAIVSMSPAETDNSSAGWITTTSSWASTRAGSGVGGGVGASGEMPMDIPRPPLAWAGVRHQTQLHLQTSSQRQTADESGTGTANGRGSEKGSGAHDTALAPSYAPPQSSLGQEGTGELGVDDGPTTSHCSQAVLLTCLHLSHEMGLRDVGQYAWTTPLIKDSTGSMMKIMKEYSAYLRAACKNSDLQCRSAPDPSKAVIQHNLQRARLAAGQNGYVVVLYNGHGIQEPPTDQGELWCYDKGFDECLQSGAGPSEYIPIMLFDVLAWAGASTCYVWDCSYSGRIIRSAHLEAEEIDNQYRAAALHNPATVLHHPPVYTRRQIHFAACGSGQSLPHVHGMPDDLFTACLLTPLRIALLFHNLQTFPLTKGDGLSHVQKNKGFMAAFWENMSQGLKDRLWYELDAITHTIAWQTLDGWEYQKLFGRSGDVISNFASGFLLSQRVLGAYRTTPESIPSIPSSTGHALWTTWDLILDNLFEQLPKYFDEGKIDHSWEKDLKLVSFMADQLESITTAGQSLLGTDTPRSGMTPGLTRLPIVCAAAMTKTFRVQACSALDSCLRVLDVRGLAHAVQGGALDVAARLLSLEDSEIKAQMISIWSSLVRYDVAVLSLAKDGLTAAHLSDVPAVRFFLSALQEALGNVSRGSSTTNGEDDNDDNTSEDREEDPVTLVIQTAAVLSTIANHVRGRSAPRFVLRTLSMGGVMLKSDTDLVRQWGALLIAEVLGSLDKPEESGVTDGLKAALLVMSHSISVESRATAVYALTRWLPPLNSECLASKSTAATELDRALVLVGALIPSAAEEGSPLVRRELARMFVHVLELGQSMTEMAIWVHILRQAHHSLSAYSPDEDITPSEASKRRIEEAIRSTGKTVGITPDQLGKIKSLQKLLETASRYLQDPDTSVAHSVRQVLERMVGQLHAHMKGDNNDELSADICQLAFPRSAPRHSASTEAEDSMNECAGLWTEGRIDHALRIGEHFEESHFRAPIIEPRQPAERPKFKERGRSLLRDKGKGKGKEADKLREKDGDRERDKKAQGIKWRKCKGWNNELFERHKLSLQAYLAAGRRPDPIPEKVINSQGLDPKERTWSIRHRLLEDSLVVAEQQVGVIWNWEMKDVVHPEPLSTMACHSFHTTVMSCNGTQDLLLWDWSRSHKTGRIHLDLPPNAAITSARFVNELHEQTVILAEINNGDVHILAGPHDPARIKPIACFKALDLPPVPPPSRTPPSGSTGGESGMSKTKLWERRMVTTWFRSSGLLCVGGMSEKINVWDCPAERCVQTLHTQATSAITTLITEPVSGNLIFSGSADGEVMIYDLRQSRRVPLLTWRGDLGLSGGDTQNHHDQLGSRSGALGARVSIGRAMKKVGVVLGESKNVTTACANGLVNIYDLRKLTCAVSSLLVNPNGIAGASFQAHSGLLSTVSKLSLPSISTGQAVTRGQDVGIFSPRNAGSGSVDELGTGLDRKMDQLSLSPAQRAQENLPGTSDHNSMSNPMASSPISQSTSATATAPTRTPTAGFTLLRSSLGSLQEVTSSVIRFSSAFPSHSPSPFPSHAQSPIRSHTLPPPGIAEEYQPYTAFHSLRPIVGIGLGRQVFLRGCGARAEGDGFRYGQ